MASKGISMRGDNKGLTVAINLFPGRNVPNAKTARLWIRGKATNVETKQVKIFNEPGTLLKTIGNWNAAKYKQRKRSERRGT